MEKETNPVQPEPKDDGVAPEKATPESQDGVTKDVTPVQSSKDAEADSKMKEMEEQIARYEQDVRKLKSTFQRRETELNEQMRKQRSEFQRQMDEAQRSVLDEDGLKEYETKVSKQRAAELERELAQREQALQEERATRNAILSFEAQGVPMRVLLEAAEEGGINAVTQAGWDWMSNELANLRKLREEKAPESPPKTEPEEPKPAPKTVTDKAVSPHAPTWKEIEEKYGSREDFYSKLEAGQVPLSELPIKKES